MRVGRGGTRLHCHYTRARPGVVIVKSGPYQTNGDNVDTQAQVLRILDEALSLGGRSVSFTADTPLLGAVPELDSMGVVSLIGAMEDRFGITVNDDEISGDTFATVESLTRFVAEKLGG